MTIENYSKQSIKCYISKLNHFLRYVKKLYIDKITDNEKQNFLFYCKDNKRYYFSTVFLIAFLSNKNKYHTTPFVFIVSTYTFFHY